MDKTPTPMDISLPNVGGARPVAGYDVGAFGVGGQALARGGERLGAGIENSAEQIAAKATEMQRQSVQTGLSNLSTAYVQNRNQYSLSNDPADLTNWQNANKAAETKFNTSTPDPSTPLGAHAQSQGGLMAAEEGLRISERGKAIASSTAEAGILQNIDSLAADTVYDPSGKPDLASGIRMQSLHADIVQ